MGEGEEEKSGGGQGKGDEMMDMKTSYGITFWNNSVVDGRRQLLVLASETFKGYVKKLDREDRRPYAEWFAQKARLNSDEEKIILATMKETK